MGAGLERDVHRGAAHVGAASGGVAQGRREGEPLLPGVEWAEDPYAAAEGAHLVCLLTEWNQFRALDLPRLAQAMAEPRMADLRNIYDPDDVRAAGFTAYDGVGRPGFGPAQLRAVAE